MQHRLDTFTAEFEAVLQSSEKRSIAAEIRLEELSRQLDELASAVRQGGAAEALTSASQSALEVMLSGNLAPAEIVTATQHARQRATRMDATTLTELFFTLQRDAAEWNACDVLFTCPVTSFGVAQLFPNATQRVMTDATQIARDFQIATHSRIGIASPWLMDRIIKDPYARALLVRACRDRLLFVDGMCSGAHSVERRRELHQAGMYEISLLVTDPAMQQSSIATTSDGTFDLRGPAPALSALTNDWRTHVATRAAIPHIDALPWQSSNLVAVGSDWPRLCAYPGTYAYAITGDREAQGPAVLIRAEAEAGWNIGATGFAGLIASCNGPGQTNCYRGATQWHHDGAFASIWKHDGEWTTLTSARIPPELISERDGIATLPMWLEVRGDDIVLGSGHSEILATPDNTIPRVGTAGIAVGAPGHWISNFSYRVISER